MVGAGESFLLNVDMSLRGENYYCVEMLMRERVFFLEDMGRVDMRAFERLMCKLHGFIFVYLWEAYFNLGNGFVRK